MEQDQDVLDSLLTGLTDRDRSGLKDAMRSAQAEQLDRKQHPPRRRRRNADGELVDPASDGEFEGDVDDEFDDEDEHVGGQLTEPSR